MSKLLVDLPESIRRRAELLAAGDGISLDQFLATAAAEKIAVLEAVDYLAGRAARADESAFEKVLAKVPQIEAEHEWDRPAK